MIFKKIVMKMMKMKRNKTAKLRIAMINKSGKKEDKKITQSPNNKSKDLGSKNNNMD